MSYNQTVQCPNCHTTYNVNDRKKSEFIPVSKPDFMPGTNRFPLAVLTQCPSCLFCVVVYATSYGHQSPVRNKPVEFYDVQYWYPKTFTKADERLPEPFKSDLNEALKCLSIDCSNAASVMCRRIISQLAINLGADPNETTGRHLNYLSKNELIEPKLLEVAKTIKNFGDDGAHPPDSVSQEDAHKTVKVTERILYYSLLLNKEFD